MCVVKHDFYCLDPRCNGGTMESYCNIYKYRPVSNFKVLSRGYRCHLKCQKARSYSNSVCFSLELFAPTPVHSTHLSFCNTCTLVTEACKPMSNLFVHIDLLAVVFLDISIRQQTPNYSPLIISMMIDNKFSAYDHARGS